MRSCFWNSFGNVSRETQEQTFFVKKRKMQVFENLQHSIDITVGNRSGFLGSKPEYSVYFPEIKETTEHMIGAYNNAGR